MSGMTLRAPAKLNLHLGIHAELDERRYHRAESVMVAVDVFDTVVVTPLNGKDANPVPEVVCDPPVGIPAHKNTAYRAAMELSARANRAPAVRIAIHKHVPDQAGLGGSSSDAAAVLRALCRLWCMRADEPVVLEAARATGADVPFFLDPVPTLLVGAGDVVAEKFPRISRPISVVLARPDGPGVSTPAAYAAFDEEHEDPRDPAALCAVLRSGEADARSIAPLLANNLDSVAQRLLPAVREVRAWLLAQPETVGGQVTGSGSCVFALCENDVAATHLADAAKKKFGCWAKSAHIM